MDVPELTASSSRLRWNLAYQDVCFRFCLDRHYDGLDRFDSFDFVSRFLQRPDHYLKIAGMCISVRPKADFFDAALMSASELAFAKQTCKAMSLNQRFVCSNQFQLSSYEAGVMLLHAYLLGSAPPLWQRVKLAIDAKVVDELDFPEGSIEIHQSILKRLWKLVDYFIATHSEGAALEA